MQWTACIRSRVLIIYAVYGGVGGFAYAIPMPPRLLLQDKVKTVRVMLGSHERGTVSGHDLTINNDIRLKGNSVFNLRCGTDLGSKAAYVEFGGGRRALGRLEISSPKGLLRLNERLYRDRLVIQAKGSRCVIINALDLEKYIAGVIAKEMSPSWPLEALKAQAIASRSYALFQMNAGRNREYDLESTTQDQVYEGAGAESARTVQAVEATRSLTLNFENTSIKAYFHANCGGVTEIPEFVWGGEAKAFRPVICPYHHRHRDRTNWSLRLTHEQIENALKKISGLLPRSFLRLASLEAGAPNESERLSDVAISDTQGNSLLVSANTFRNAIGNTRMKSTSFRVNRSPAGYTLEGKGNGHGVGMCQVGARAMAEEGRSFEQILRFYYPLAKIRRVL